MMPAAFDFESFKGMILFSLISPLIASLLTALTTYINNITPRAWAKIKPWIIKPENSVTIRVTRLYSTGLAMWRCAPEEWENIHLIQAILLYVTKRNLNSTQMRYSLDENGACMHGPMHTWLTTLSDNLIPIEPIYYNGMKIVYCQSDKDPTTKQSSEKRFETITVSSKKSTDDIKKFIRECFDEYIASRYPKEKVVDPHYYVQTPNEEGLRFKKYKIEKFKTSFDDMFFPEKEKIIEMVNKLQNGDIAKLSLLLYGLPGCGKTSVIRAIAALTGKSIICVKLGFIKSDAQMLDVFHNTSIIYHKNNDTKFEITNDYVPLDKRIYIFEDVDAETDVVHKREAGTKSKSEESSTQTPVVVVSGGSSAKEAISAEMMKEYKRERLSLSGVLNALDGVLELNGSIIILTTNHPEKLDPAFIRHGRVTMRLELKKMLAVEANKLIYKYFKATINNLHDHVFTPADLDSMCQTSSSIAELAQRIARYKEGLHDEI